MPEPIPDQRVTVTNFDISFWNLMWLFVKAAIAVIPAAIILAIIGALCAGIFAGIVRSH